VQRGRSQAAAIDEAQALANDPSMETLLWQSWLVLWLAMPVACFYCAWKSLADFRSRKVVAGSVGAFSAVSLFVLFFGMVATLMFSAS
jgi:hypothetical protein